jgi:hypothetical protein
MQLKGIGKLSGVLTALLILALLFPAFGCGRSNQAGSDDGWSDENQAATTAGNGGETQATITQTGTSTIHMCGRSVLGGWFEQWGWDYDPHNPVKLDGYTLVYHEMESPPGITDTAIAVARAMGDQGGGIMFFKLCFADFTGGDGDSARGNLAANQEIIREVTKVAVDQEGLTLILGNALPMVREYTDNWLVWNHREYNHFLEDLAASHKGRVLILDLYGTLAAPDGWLRPDFAAEPEDSHLNGKAYTALDAVFLKLLDALPASP